MSPYKIPDNVLFQEVDGEAVLLALDEGFYYGLDELGTRIWKLIGEGLEMEQVVDVVVKEYAVERDQAREDIGKFLGELEESGLITQPLP